MSDDATPRGPAYETYESSTIAFTGFATARACVLPESIGRYRIRRLIAEGGMGAVYEAEQEQPHRTVALKVIKSGFVSHELLRRFEQEAQALGRLHHPGIAQIYEAGNAESEHGPQPYFAMEFIEGPRLLDYANQHKLKTRERLELMASVCDAVEHAHQRGLIHRDLKPANILVDAHGQPKILDFGVARVVESDAEATRQTDVGQIVGTLPYMSPEQVSGDPDEIDTRTDVYALGVVLFEMLSGRLPYDVDRKQLPQAVQVIREQDPTPLSSLSRNYRGDIETIVAKSLEKEKQRRYGSAAEMASDIRCYLGDQPITARPPSTAYQLKKFARRHRALVTGVVAVIVVLLAGVIVSSTELVRARRAEMLARQSEGSARTERDRAINAEAVAKQERDRAVAAEHTAASERDRAVNAETQAKQQRDAAIAARQRADAETAKATAINDFLQNDLLAQASSVTQGNKADPEIKVRTVLDRAAERVANRFANQPEVEASIENTIGRTYKDIGAYNEAQQHLGRSLAVDRRVLGPEAPKTLLVAKILGETYRSAGKYANAEALLQATIEALKRTQGADARETLDATNVLCEVYVAQGKNSLAEPALTSLLEREKRALAPDDSILLDTMSTLARVNFMLGRLPQAEELLLAIIAGQTRVYGAEHKYTIGTMNNLAVLYQRESKYKEAETLYDRVLRVQRQILGVDHPETLNTENNLAVLYMAEDKLSEAEPLQRHVLELWKKELGPEHPRTLTATLNLGLLLSAVAPETREADELIGTACEGSRHALGADRPETLDDCDELALVYERRGKLAEAESLLVSSLATRRRVSGEQSTGTRKTESRLGELRLLQGRPAEAEKMLRQALEGQDLTPSELYARHWSESLLGAALTTEKRYAEAEPLLLQSYDGMRTLAPKVNALQRRSLKRGGEFLVQLYDDWGKPEKADEWRQKLR